MTFATLPIGTQIAITPPTSSTFDHEPTPAVTTTGDLLAILSAKQFRSLPMLKTTCGLLGKFLELPGDQIPLDLIEAKKRAFRPFLQCCRYSENSIRTFIYEQRVLLKTAGQYGWLPDGNPTEAWKQLLGIASDFYIKDLVRHLARSAKSPAEVTQEDLNSWGVEQILNGGKYSTVVHKKGTFWRLLRKAGYLSPEKEQQLKSHAMPMDELPTSLKKDAQALLAWKQAKFAPGRPQKGKLRPITAVNLQQVICQLAGFVINICGGTPESLKDLVQKHYVEGYVAWMINDRQVRGRSIHVRVGGLAAALKYHPDYAGMDWTWFKPLLDAIPFEEDSDLKKRKAQKFIPYETLETIPDQLHAYREAYAKRRNKDLVRIAQLFMEELMIRWLLVLPMRQRNLRECRIDGIAPNLYKGRIPPLSEIDRPTWALEEEARNPNAEFWLLTFRPEATKTHVQIDMLLPRQLIAPLEEYLDKWRPLLLNGHNPDTLFVSSLGKPLRSDQINRAVGHWSLTFTGTRSTPHLFRDAVAFAWLKAHPKDFLTLAKLLWHSNIQTTIKIYGSRFNPSCGSTAMEAWLDQRAAGQN